MKLSSLACITAIGMTSPVMAQTLMHYRFDGNCGLEAINYAVGSNVGNGTFTTTMPAPAPWTTGQFNTGMSGSVMPGSQTTVLNTNWSTPNYSGDFSIAFWVRNRPGNNTTISFGYLFGSDGGNFRCFTGSAGRVFFAGFPSQSLSNAADLTSLLNAGYVHVACTVDATTLQWNIYINGTVDQTGTLSGAPVISNTGFALGARDTGASNPSPFDMDEFVMTTTVLTPSEITALAADARAGDGEFGTTCGPNLAGNGQRPTIGNANYAIELTGPTSGVGWFVMGLSRCSLGQGAVQLPIPLDPYSASLAGCFGQVDTDLGSFGPLPIVGGTCTLPVPIPSAAVLSGMTAYAQGFALDGATAQLVSSNAMSIGLGY